LHLPGAAAPVRWRGWRYRETSVNKSSAHTLAAKHEVTGIGDLVAGVRSMTLRDVSAKRTLFRSEAAILSTSMAAARREIGVAAWRRHSRAARSMRRKLSGSTGRASCAPLSPSDW